MNDTEKLKEAINEGLKEIQTWESINLKNTDISSISSFLNGFVIGYLGLDK